jgi:hypothetical protein
MTIFKLVTTNKGKNGAKKLTYNELVQKFQSEHDFLKSLGFKFKDKNEPQESDDDEEVGTEVKFQLRCKIQSIPEDTKDQYRITCIENNKMIIMKKINGVDTPIVLFDIEGFTLKISVIYKEYY